MAYNRENNIGKQFGEITVIEFVRVAKGSSIYLGKCSCGNVREYYIGNLRSGKTHSCGCKKSEFLAKKSTIHGDRHTRLYSIWTNMKTRCYNEKSKSYSDYGAKGISICDEWINSYENFKNWAIQNGYEKDLSIDRIDYRGNYSPDNCRWSDATTQCRNRSCTWEVCIDGVTKTAKEWCDLYGVPYKTAHTRKSRGWDDVLAVSVEPKSVRDYKSYVSPHAI